MINRSAGDVQSYLLCLECKRESVITSHLGSKPQYCPFCGSQKLVSDDSQETVDMTQQKGRGTDD